MNTKSALPFLLCSVLCSFGFSDCGPSFPGDGLLPPPPDPTACESLGEASCIARNDCRAEYEVPGCACAPCLASEDGLVACPECACEDPSFSGCVSLGPCEGLSEAQCIADASCQPIYETPICVCPACAPNPNDPNDRACDCNCDAIGPAVETYQGCQLREPCSGLSEAQCIAEPGCSPIYSETYCGGDSNGFRAPCEGEDCHGERPCTQEVSYEGCGPDAPVCPAVLCDIACRFGHTVDENGCAICGCNPPPNKCAELDELTCGVTPGCEPRYDASCGGSGGGDGGGARPCDPGNGDGCGEPPPCDPVQTYLGCFPSETVVCPAGEHVSYISEDPAQCAAIFFECVDGSRPFSDECGCGCIGGMDPPPPVCSDGSEILCDAIPGECPPSTVIGIRNGCFSCVDPFTCQDVWCHDGNEISCRALPPICDDGQGLSIQNGCWSCVDPLTCQ